MGISFKYVPPKVNALAVLASAAPAAAQAAAQVILNASQPQVPVEEGVLKASGRTVSEGLTSYITYGRDDDGDSKHAPSNQYAVKQHEDLTLNHPNGGNGKFLEDPMHSEAPAAAMAAAMVLREAFKL